MKETLSSCFAKSDFWRKETHFYHIKYYCKRGIFENVRMRCATSTFNVHCRISKKNALVDFLRMFTHML